MSPPQSPVYKAVRFRDIIANGLQDQDGQPLLSQREIMPAQQLQVAPISFGDVEMPEFACVEHPPGWNHGVIAVPPVRLTTLRNAVVHGGRGFVTVGEHFLADAMRLPVFQSAVATMKPDGSVEITGAPPEITVGAAGHLFCGYPANRNYAHFLIDVIASALVPPLNDGYAGMSVLMPEPLSRYQRAYLNYFPELTQRAVYLSDTSKIACDTLTISSFSTDNAHFRPNAYHRQVALFLRERVLASSRPDRELPRKIYVSRTDSSVRKLLNETQIIEIAARYGFTSVTLSDLSLENQIRLFANATHVLAPHGAGLANMLFANPGTVLCELLQNGYVKWSMRFFASLVPARYGCVIGQDVDPAQDLGQRVWKIDPVRVEYALASMPA